jgi:heme O synthase-like polyprenyltransferase
VECVSTTFWEATLVLNALPLCLQVVGILHTINIVITLVWPAWFIYEAQAGEWSSKKHALRSFSVSHGAR